MIKVDLSAVVRTATFDSLEHDLPHIAITIRQNQTTGGFMPILCVSITISITILLLNEVLVYYNGCAMLTQPDFVTV